MQIKKKDINNILTFFLLSHLIIWTLVPAISNNNLPLDTIEALAWGSDLDWGYNKHPPLSALVTDIFYRIFGNQDWAYYFLSQLFVVSTFFIIFQFSKDFFENKYLGLISILLLEGIYFYNFTTPEFNVNVCQLPFWALTVFYFWKGIKENTAISWLLFGVFSALGVLSKYLFIYLLVAIDIFIIYYLIVNKKNNFKFLISLISLISFIIILLPHVFWLVDNDYITINYALKRTGIEESNFIDHIYFPLIFLGKQIGIIIPFLILFFVLISKFKTKIKKKDKKLIFLIIINIAPLILIFLTSLFMGVKIRTMWMTPFYLFLGVLFVYIFQKRIAFNKLKYFFSVFLIFFFLSPAVYFLVSLSQKDKRTDYPGKQIAKVVNQEWENIVKSNELIINKKIEIIGWDEWYAGNLSYHLGGAVRPKVYMENFSEAIAYKKNNFILITESEAANKVCSLADREGIKYLTSAINIMDHNICFLILK